ncbi:MAG: hypothetical protein QOD39_2304, partial [Mycobacterium sp.]|nr:hypothetical protein [Mycobacterium sp.]
MATLSHRSHTTLSPDQMTAVKRLIGRAQGPVDVAGSWRSRAIADFASKLIAPRVHDSTVAKVVLDGDGQARLLLESRRGRRDELWLRFASESAGLITNMSIRPVLSEGVTVRSPHSSDASAIRQLDLSAPVVRDDGTRITIDHNATQFDHAAAVTDHRYLAAFRGEQMIAAQGVSIESVPIDGVLRRVAFNHHSRSAPQSRGEGAVFHLIMALYHDVFPVVDQLLSIVDVHNGPGLRLSLGQPWPTRVRRLFIPVAALAQMTWPTPSERTFEPGHAATLLNAT